MFGLHGSAVSEPHPKRHIIFVQTKVIYPLPLQGGLGWVLSFILKKRRKVTKKK